jgi:putative serine protease PepD
MVDVNELPNVEPSHQEPHRHFLSRRAAAVAATFAAVAIGAAAGASVYARTAGSTTTVTETTAAASNVSNTSRPLTVAELYRKNVKGVVQIETTATESQPTPFGGTDSQSAGALGTGFVYDRDGDIVTNEHVVDGATSISVKFADGSTSKATVVGTDASHDLAVIHVDAPAAKLQPLELGDSDTVQVGDDVVAIGDQFGLTDSVTTGIVSALNRKITSPNSTPIRNAIQTDAAINHGSSGGPLFAADGRVIGITSQIDSSSNGNNGVGFAIPSNTVKSVVTRLLGNA